MPPPRIAVTLGDPAGIGPEVIVKALADPTLRHAARLFVIGATAPLHAAIHEAGSPLTVRPLDTPHDPHAGDDPHTIDTWFPPETSLDSYQLGRVTRAAGAASHVWAAAAARLALDGHVDAIVTAPINKEAWRAAGIDDIGHQELYKRLSGAGTVATMLVSGRLRCVHLSTHLPLEEACRAVTRARVLDYLRLADTSFRDWGIDRPRIAVAALNPHASDGGLMGDTEAREIAPAVADAQAAGIDATGPIPADSVFSQALAGRYDVVLVMYHDQGHIAIKVHGFEESVSVNLGLPFLRTSVDHGTAFDIAGRNVADPTSMREAIALAARLAARHGLD